MKMLSGRGFTTYSYVGREPFSVVIYQVGKAVDQDLSESDFGMGK